MKMLSLVERKKEKNPRKKSIAPSGIGQVLQHRKLLINLTFKYLCFGESCYSQPSFISST
jgi:hypothetical protein